MPKLPIPALGSLMDIASAIQKIDINEIGGKIDVFVSTAQQCLEICKRIERKLDAVIDAAEIKVQDVGHSASSSNSSGQSANISIGNNNGEVI